MKKLAVIIVNYNGYKYTKRCIHSVLKSNFKNLDLVIVDNGSTDSSYEKLTLDFKNFRQVKIIKLKKNFGPAYARNIGVKKTKSLAICFLDNDTEVDKKWAEEPIELFESNPKVGVIQSKLLLMNDPKRIDYVGEYVGQNGFLVQVAEALTLDDGKFDSKIEILAAKSAGMFIRRKTFDKVGGFDDDYFIYVEETDLGWRSCLAGFSSIFVPSSRVLHEFGTSSLILGASKNEYNAKFHGCKNYILTNFKNLSTLNLVRILPLHIGLWFGLSLFLLAKGKLKAFFWINKGIFWNLVNLNSSIKKRRLVQKSRVVSDSDLFEKLMKKKDFKYYLSKAVVKKSIGNAQGFIKNQH